MNNKNPLNKLMLYCIPIILPISLLQADGLFSPVQTTVQTKSVNTTSSTSAQTTSCKNNQSHLHNDF